MYLLKYHSLDHAILMGTKHLMTFDGKIYDLASNCSVLLAKDFVHDTFTVILNEETSNSRSLYVEMNQTVISIYPRLKVGGEGQTFFLSRPDIIFNQPTTTTKTTTNQPKTHTNTKIRKKEKKKSSKY